MDQKSQAERLCDLFADQVKSGLDDGNVTLKNGQKNLALALGISPGSVSHWRNRGGGRVPLDWYSPIFEAAERAKISRAALAEILMGAACPCCGRAIELGAVEA